MRHWWIVVLVGCGSTEADPGTRPCAGVTCDRYGYAPGPTGCTREGDVDLARCTPLVPDWLTAAKSSTCGNGKIDVVKEQTCAPCTPPGPCPCGEVEVAVEDCDGAALGGATCGSVGFVSGTLACSKQCRRDTSGCSNVDPKHPFPKPLRIGGLVGYSSSNSIPAALAAVPGQLGVAWALARQPDMHSDVVFAWTDPSLASLRTTTVTFNGGQVSELELDGNASGWLLAVSTFGDNPGPLGPAVRVFPISPRGVVGPPGRRVDRQGVLFVRRGGKGEPALVGALHGFMQPTRQGGAFAQFRIDAWLVDDRGEPTTGIFTVGSGVDAVLRASAAYIGGGRFITARGSTRDQAIELAIVDMKGKVSVLPTAHADLTGTPTNWIVSGDKLQLAWTNGKGTFTMTIAPDGAIVGAPARVAGDAALGLLRPTAKPALAVTSSGAGGAALSVLPPGAAPARVLGGDIYVPRIATAEDGSYALVSTPSQGFVVRLR